MKHPSTIAVPCTRCHGSGSVPIPYGYREESDFKPLMDMMLSGNSYTVDGKRVSPERVTIELAEARDEIDRLRAVNCDAHGGKGGPDPGPCPLCERDAAIADLEVERDALRRKLAAECETCEGSGIMSAPTGEVKAPDGEEVHEDTICGECHGSGKGWIAEAIREAQEPWREVVRRLPHRSDCPAGAPGPFGPKEKRDAWRKRYPCRCGKESAV